MNYNSAKILTNPGPVGRQNKIILPCPTSKARGKMPQYVRDKLVELQLQDKFDELEAVGVFRHPVLRCRSGGRVSQSFISRA